MADFKIEIADEGFKEQWDEFVLAHPLGTFFHLFDWLRLAEWKTGFSLKPLVIESGGNIYGLMPVFVKKYYGITLCLSPPPKMATPWMGPLFKTPSDKQYGVEKQTWKMTVLVNELLRERLGADFIRITCVAGFNDVRPFKWLGYECSPSYTYFLDITDKDRVFEELDGRIRTGIRKAQKNGLYYKQADNSQAVSVIDAVSARYKEQGFSFALNKELIRRLMRVDAGKSIEVTSVFDEEGFVTGNIMIKLKNQVHHWIGGVYPRRNHQGANEFLHWSDIQRYSEEGINYYELMGGNTKHLCDHKSKYNPDLRTFYICEWHNARGRLVSLGRRVLGKKTSAD
ncbi:MAG: GNAT family N-acetyltransferase [Desulfosalsimonas sp.]